VGGLQRCAVGVPAKAAELRAALDAELGQSPGLHLRVVEEHRGSQVFLDVSAEGEDEGAFRTHLAHALADHIVNHLEPALLARLVASHYGYLDGSERESLLAYADRNLGENGADAAKVRRKRQIMERLLDYLEQAEELNLEGFVRFRLKDYMEELEDAVDRAMDDFLLEREYEEFVRLLRYFVDVQEPKMGLAHVVVLPDGRFRIFNEVGDEVESQVLRQFVVEMLDADIAYEDLMVSALITLAPRAILLHDRSGQQASESVETVSAVFQGRIDFCDGCGFCRARARQREPLT
jgi:putative sporulation protein YtxC